MKMQSIENLAKSQGFTAAMHHLPPPRHRPLHAGKSAVFAARGWRGLALAGHSLSLTQQLPRLEGAPPCAAFADSPKQPKTACPR